LFFVLTWRSFLFMVLGALDPEDEPGSVSRRSFDSSPANAACPSIDG
jgi:hypothetical protein